MRRQLAGLRPGPPKPDDRTGVTALERSDLAAINHWLSVTRLRTVAIVLVGIPLIEVVGTVELPWRPIALISCTAAAVSLIYEWVLGRGGDLRRLVYVQLTVDTGCIAAGLAVMGPTSLLFGHFFLMTIVPGAMVSGVCAIVMTVLGGAGLAVLLATNAISAVHTVTPETLLAIGCFIFASVANQCFFYKTHLRDKNRHLAETSDRLASTNAELTVTADTALGLLEVGRAVGISLDLGVVLDRLHTVAADRLRTDWCATLLVDPQSPACYRLLASRGLGSAASAPLGDGFWNLGALVVADELVEIPDAAAPEGRALRQWGVASGLFTLMRYGSRAVGIFATGYGARAGGFEPFQRELATGIGNQAAVAIENATLHARQREEAETSAALLRVSELLNANFEAENLLEQLTAVAAELVGYERVSVLLLDPVHGTFRLSAGTDTRGGHWRERGREIDIPVDEFPVLERAARDGLAETWRGDGRALVRDVWWDRLGVSSILVVPLHLRGTVIGALSIGTETHTGPFRPATRRLLGGIAYQTVTAIENGRLLRTLRAANTLKSEFISTMSHELRTPLNAIIGYNELLGDGEFGPVTGRQQEICGKVLDSSRQLLELIQATLDVSRMESGALPVQREQIELPRLLDDLARQMPTSWVRAGVEVSFTCEPDVPVIESDYPKLKMVVRNLVHNALKFTEQGSVRVRAVCDGEGGGVVITVVDTGIGISADAQAIIFDMFRQVDGSDRRRHDGVGLGLYIVRRLTQLLGGSVTLDSEIGRGSAFHIRLPLRPGRRRPAPEASAAASP